MLTRDQIRQKLLADKSWTPEDDDEETWALYEEIRSELYGDDDSDDDEDWEDDDWEDDEE